MLRLSVIIPRSPEAVLTKEWCVQQLGGDNYEIIIAKTWQRGLDKAKGEFVTFLEKDCVLGPNYFATLLDAFDERPSFRKLAMVAPTLGINSWTKKVYGYNLYPNKVVPINERPSSEPHRVQIAYLPGAILRHSTINAIAPKRDDFMLDSVNFSIYFWNNGNMILMHPGVTYISSDEQLDLPYHIDTPLDYPALSKMFRREMGE